MLLDMLGTDMYVSYNVKLAHKIGLHASIYITELLNINRKAIQKEKTIDDIYFKVDRDYIVQRTTLKKDEQKQLDEMLSDLGVVKINKSSKDVITLDVDALTGILLDDRRVVESQVKEVVKSSKQTKQDKIVESVKRSVPLTDPELRKAYFVWIDSVFARYGWMSTAAVTKAQREIDSYTGKDLDMAIDILNNAAVNGDRDIDWTIDRYRKNHKFANSPIQQQVPSHKEVLFTDEVF